MYFYRNNKKTLSSKTYTANEYPNLCDLEEIKRAAKFSCQPLGSDRCLKNPDDIILYRRDCGCVYNTTHNECDISINFDEYVIFSKVIFEEVLIGNAEKKLGKCYCWCTNCQFFEHSRSKSNFRCYEGSAEFNNHHYLYLCPICSVIVDKRVSDTKNIIHEKFFLLACIMCNNYTSGLFFEKSLIGYIENIYMNISFVIPEYCRFFDEHYK